MAGRLLVSMTTSIDGFINDAAGAIDWTEPDADLFAFHLARVRTLGGCVLGRRLYQDMLVWENDPSLPTTPAMVEFAEVWTALPKVVFSRSLDQVQGNARLATGSVAEEVGAMLAETGRDVEIGGADLAGQALAADLVDELRIFRAPVVLGGGTPLLPALGAPLVFERRETRPFPNGVVYERYLRRRTRG
ncbi:dihydrofolate reductase family protein [Nocardioides sp.]|uniref:dihydrofolate reductase family protein n=1 Tax=Nocardioides sp. TaxID=35761 RepID=UPI00261137D9|nr:dihydrofolate reductase family protein [Nocardioides sp.]